MEVIGEVVLSVSLELLLGKLSSSDLLKYAREVRVLSELKKWEGKLLEVREVLEDAEKKQISKQSVKAWLGGLRDLAYDMEDVLDEFNCHLLRRKLVPEAGSKIKVCKFIPTAFTRFSSNVMMGSKIKDITSRLEEISAGKAEFGLEKVAAIATQSTIWETRPLTTSLVYEPEVYGRDADKQIIIDLLLRDEHELADQTNVSVVPIVAMGGMGKTTLARLVYDDVEIDKHFNLKAWVCVSDQYDVLRVTKTLLHSVMTSQRSSFDSLDFNQIQEQLREKLKGKKFLLVLDDMWNDNYGDWCCLQSPFLSGSQGSKIIVTTRNTSVANMMGGDKNLHKLKSLSNDECWLVFKKHAFGNCNIHEQSTLALTGKEIVKKCGGLPLAARALGGLLRHEQRQDRWNAVLTSKLWELTESSIIPALRLSYDHLSPHLKRCFAYCAIFPKDHELEKEELILLWMAEGLIQQSNDHEEKEDVGDEYFLELLSKSFFQLSTSDGSRFVMHDLVHDLAKFVAKETCLHLDDKLENNSQHSNFESIRHLSYISHGYETFQRFERLHKKSHMRTFINLLVDSNLYISNKVLKELIPELGHLRVLSLSGYGISEIPDSFGKLKHLRYLNLSRTGIQCLPDSIGDLFYLQTLKLSKCMQLSKLPISIGNLINLRHLDVSGSYKLREMPSQIGKLKDLRFLSNFMVGENNGLNIKELSSMRNLGGELCISKLENVVNIEDARDTGLKSKHKLKSLKIEWWNYELNESGKEKNQMGVLHSLQPPSNLEKLRIESYGGLAFPGWISDASLLSKVVELSLVNCKKCMSLPCFGQLPSLKQLWIEEMHGIKKVGAEFYFYGESTQVFAYKCFGSLESLRFANMPEWEHWEEEEDWSSSMESLFPCLHELIIENCPKLIKNIPIYLPVLAKLHVYNCLKLEFPALRLPSLKKLHVRRCNGTMLRSGIVLTSLTKLSIDMISGLAKLHKGFLQSLRGLQALEIMGSDELTWLWDDDDNYDGSGSENIPSHEIRRCHQLVSLGLGCNLRSLEMYNCAKLERLPSGWQSLKCLEELYIGNCRNLVSFPEVGFPPNLRRLTVARCEGLKCLPDGMMLKTMSNNNFCLLESLEIRNCSSLICFPKGQLPTTLKTLKVESCKNLRSLPEGIMMHLHCNAIPMGICGLEDLSVDGCQSLTDFPEGSLPTTLKQLKIGHCKNLKSLPEGIMQQHSNSTTTTSALQVLEFYGCPSLTSFPRGRFPSTLKQLHILYCEQLESISEEMFHSSSTNNYSLQSLRIEKCSSLKTLSDCLSDLSAICIRECKNLELRPQQFQNFTRLTSLEIFHCGNIETPLYQWGLARLPSLKSLSIKSILSDATSFSFSDDHHSNLLPTTLTSLDLGLFQNLESLASLSLQNLSSLEDLSISHCPKLRSILPRKKLLPPTLSSLWIHWCPLLQQRYSKEKGKDWAKIAHIPYVCFN